MRVFQILDNNVLIIKDNEQYSDTAEHFKEDSGLADLPIKVIYDDTQKQCLVDDDFKDYPNAEYDGYIDNVTAYIDAKAQREYTPSTMDELKDVTQIKKDTTQTPSLSERIAVLEDTVNTLMEGVPTNG